MRITLGTLLMLREARSSLNPAITLAVVYQLLGEGHWRVMCPLIHPHFGGSYQGAYIGSTR